MKKILSLLLIIFANNIAESKYVTNNTHIVDIPNHWTHQGWAYEGTNYLVNTFSTNLIDTGVGVITNITTQSSAADDWYKTFEYYAPDAYIYGLSTQFVEQVSTGNFQLLPLSELDNWLETFGSNQINSYYSSYDYEEGIEKSDISNLISFPAFTTNGMIIKKFQFDFISSTNDPYYAAAPGIYYSDTLNTKIFVFDNSSFYDTEVAVERSSADFSFGVNIENFVSTTDPIPQYYDGVILSPEERTYFANTNNESIYYVRIDFPAETNKFVYLDIAEGESLNTQSKSTPSNVIFNNGILDPGCYAFYYEINRGDTGYLYESGPENGVIKTCTYEVSNLMGPARIRFAFNGNLQAYRASDNSAAYMLFRVERSDNYYLTLLENINEQLSNSISSPAETVFITNTVNQTSYVTNSITNSVGYSLSEIQDLRVGSKTFSVDNGSARVRMYVDESGNLTDWTNTPHVLELDIPADTDTKFFRFRMD